MTDIQAALALGASLKASCHIIELTVSTYWRWTKTGVVTDDQRPHVIKAPPKNKLSDEEEQAVLAVMLSHEFADSPPSQIVPTLLTRGIWLASESSYYRILHANKLAVHRGRQAPPMSRAIPQLSASQPNEVWCWDVSWLKTLVAGRYYYLHLFLDLYSRKIVLAEVLENESDENASRLTIMAINREGIVHQPPKVLHSDNGGPMRSAMLKETLASLGVASSFNRPHTSNDNAFAEAIFKTAKYRPNYPAKGFKSLQEAQAWVMAFVTWYNEVHLHSGLNFVTPIDRHEGRDESILAHRKSVLEAAKQRRPERWSKETRNCEAKSTVYINKPEEERSESVR